MTGIFRRVFAFVFVRWPRHGSRFEWRKPRSEPMSISRWMFSAVSVRSAAPAARSGSSYATHESFTVRRMYSRCYSRIRESG